MQTSTLSEKEQKLLNWDCFWKPFKVQLEKRVTSTLLKLDNSSWPVKSFVSTNVRVRGIIRITPIGENLFLLAPEIVSKSSAQRKIFRMIIYNEFVLIQVDEDSISEKIFLDFLCPMLEVKQDNVKEIRINAMKIRKLAKKIRPIKLTLLVNHQTAGVEGLEELTLTGKNVIRGIQTLKDRQEVDLKADSIGPWVDLESEYLGYTMGKGVKLKSLIEAPDEILEILKSTLL